MRHEFETRSLPRLLAATCRGFAFYVANPLSFVHEFTLMIQQHGSGGKQFVTIRAIGVVILLHVWFLMPVAHIQAQTQAEMNAQARADFAKADVDLNKTYRAVLAKLPNAEKQKLKDAQRTWVASRDAEAERAAKESAGGTMAPTLRYEKMADLTRKRIAELKVIIDKGSPATKSQTPDPISPDKKWEYVGDETPRLVKANTKETAVELSCGNGGDFSTPLWAPDSKRFAISCAGGKGKDTSVYQLRDDNWIAPEDALGNGDDIMKHVDNLVDAEAKKKGMPKHTFLHMQRWTVEPERWIDPNTLVIYASMWQRAHRRDGEDAGAAFSADVFVTLRFDEAGNWKIINTRGLSDKELKQREKE